MKSLDSVMTQYLIAITKGIVRNISGTQGRILIHFFYLFVCSSSITYGKTEKMMFTPPLTITAKRSFSALRRVK